MKKRILVLLLMFFLNAILFAQEKKTPPQGIESFFKVGEKLTYKFYQNNILFGTQTTVFKGKDKFGGKPGLKFEKVLTLDLAKIKQGTAFRINAEMFLTEMGKPISYGLDIFEGDKKQRLEIVVEKDSVFALSIMGQEAQKFAKPFDTSAYLVDQSMISDYYIILNLLKPNPQKPISLKILDPRDLNFIEEKIIVEKPSQVKFAGREFEVSVYRFTPSGQKAWVTTKDRKLLRWMDEAQNLKIDLELPAKKKVK